MDYIYRKNYDYVSVGIGFYWHIKNDSKNCTSFFFQYIQPPSRLVNDCLLIEGTTEFFIV